jgi:hypothetical protein
MKTTDSKKLETKIPQSIALVTNVLFIVFLMLIPVLEIRAQQNTDELINLLVKKQLIGRAEADSLKLKPTTGPHTGVRFIPGLKVWGLAYVDVMYHAHADSAKRGNVQYSGQKGDSAGMDFRRIYLGADYAVSRRFSTQLILSNESNTDVVSNGNRSVFIKAANLRWSGIFPLSDLIVGIQQTPTFFFTGDRDGVVWEYRSVERSIADMRKLSNSSDAGIQLTGRFNETGTFGYNLMVGDGSGAKPENTKYQRLYGDIYGKFFNRHLIVDWYSDFDRSRLTPFQQSVGTFKLLVAYQSKQVTVGVEAVQQDQQNAAFYTEAKAGKPAVIGTRKDTAESIVIGLSAYVQAKIIEEKLGLFVRYDYFNPDINFSSANFYVSSYTGNTIQHFITAGLDYTPEKNIHIIPNIWYNDYVSSADAAEKINTGSLGQRDYDFVYRVTLAYTFNR